ncbi:papain family cysteine protease [Teladorsagia circumcincta]|uniref:Papain family cysteine protease n=1 Tax=Teladorsagia circumcincta TaxID=45464 RepID=A0A2G9UDK2_TELCI|nr:papain family cysteine protease [Teladorsagia circumcincta]
MKLLVFAFCIYLSRAEIPLEAQVLSGEPLVEYLKQNQKLFEVGSTPTPGFKSKLMDLRFVNQNRQPVVEDEEEDNGEIPESYDARVEWANCSSLFYIRDQANCGSCWAVSSAAAMSDRICIASKGVKQVLISAQDLVSCCSYCGYGCDGGWPIKAWQFFAREGVVTGGNYGRQGCCRPYEITPCGRHGREPYYGECYDDAATPRCKRTCQKGYKTTYKKDKRFGRKAYQLPNSVKAIQREIMTHGPVVAGYTVYEDFSYYTKGIYKVGTGKIC